jgi:glycosyltransferase involved in cell wall biosynthesis
MPLLSIVVPCYNEAPTIEGTLDALDGLRDRLTPAIQVEIVAVDDGSRDGTADIIEARSRRAAHVRLVRHAVNSGKGSAIRTARDHVRGDVVVIQDADLEYDPQDIPALIAPILSGAADAVLGSRFAGAGAHRVLYFWHRIGNGVLTLLSNMLTDLNVTDMETGYKAFRGEAFRLMHLTRSRFGIEPEMIARLSQMGARVYEVPISYHGRTYAEGKKITWRDGAAAIVHMFSARLTARRQPRLPVRARVTPIVNRLPVSLAG